MDKKCYFVSYFVKRYLQSEYIPECMVIDQHPLEWLEDRKKEGGAVWSLVSWQRVCMKIYKKHKGKEM